MFNGIVQGAYSVVTVVSKPGLMSLEVELPFSLLEGVQLGASIAVDGVCLTVSRITDHSLWFDMMGETLARTTLGSLAEGSRVNIERSARVGDEVGGHRVSGHIDGTLMIAQIHTPPNNRILTFQVSAQWMKYIFSKGYIALNGASLTVVNARMEGEYGFFEVHLIPETLRITTFSQKQVGDSVNFEIEREIQAIVDTVDRYMRSRSLSETDSYSSRSISL